MVSKVGVGEAIRELFMAVVVVFAVMALFSWATGDITIDQAIQAMEVAVEGIDAATAMLV